MKPTPADFSSGIRQEKPFQKIEITAKKFQLHFSNFFKNGNQTSLKQTNLEHEENPEEPTEEELAALGSPFLVAGFANSYPDQLSVKQQTLSEINTLQQKSDIHTIDNQIAAINQEGSNLPNQEWLPHDGASVKELVQETSQLVESESAFKNAVLTADAETLGTLLVKGQTEEDAANTENQVISDFELQSLSRISADRWKKENSTSATQVKLDTISGISSTDSKTAEPVLESSSATLTGENETLTFPIDVTENKPDEDSSFQTVLDSSKFSGSIMGSNGLPQEETAVLRQSMVRQVSEVVVEKIESLESGNRSVTQITLSPERLGDISITLELIEDKLATNIVVNSPETKQLLDNSMKQLSDTLARQHIQLGDVQITVSTGNESGFGFQDGSHQERRPRSGQQLKPGNRNESSVREHEDTSVEENGRISLLV